MQTQRLETIRQTEVAECGLACLTMIARFHGADTDLTAMRRRFEPSPRGTTLASLLAIADDIGFIGRPLRLPIDELADLELPAILHWDLNHFVVLSRIKRNRYLIHDPGYGDSWLSRSRVSDSFTGIALELRASRAFDVPEAEPRLRLRQLWTRMVGLKRAVTQTLLLGVVIEMLSLVIPYYLQVGIDTIAPSADLGLLTTLGAVFAMVVLLQGVGMLVRSEILVKSGAQIGYGLSVNLVRHVLRLPIDWFQRRKLGDVITRLSETEHVQEVFTKGPTLAFVDGLFAVVTLVVMLFYSVYLTAVTLVALGANATIRAWMVRRQSAAEQRTIEAMSREQTTIIECIRGITSIRMLGQEQTRHAVWQAQRSELTNAQTSAATIRSQGDVATAVIGGLENVASVWLAVTSIVAGTMTAGMIFAFFAIKAMFWAKSRAVVDQGIQLSLMRLHLQRLGDVALAREDKCFTERPNGVAEPFHSLELRDVSYRYSPSDPLVLRNINLVVNAGEHVAITGDSGGGKSTLLRIMLGLVEPSAGRLLVNGRDIGETGLRNYHRSIAAVLQEDTLFTGTIKENVGSFDIDVANDRVESVCRLATIDDDIAAMPLRYNTLVGDMGSTLSSGQRQRVLIARALYRAPSLLVMDEGTSHLDSRHEATIAQNLREQNMTRISVAHREETLRHATRRYLLEGGELMLQTPGAELPA